MRLVVEQDEAGGDYGGGGGYHDPGSANLARAFGLTGLMDIGKTLSYGVQKLSSKAQHLIGVTASGLAGALIPFAEGKYEEIDAAEKRRSDKLKSKYKDVFDRVDKAFYEDDFRVASFLFSPVNYLSAMAGIKAPGATLDILDTITARNDYVSAFTDSVRGKFGLKSSYAPKKKDGSLEDRLAAMFGEGLEEKLADMLLESFEKDLIIEAGLTPKNMMKMVFGQDKIKRVLANSRYIKSMQKDAQDMIKNYVNDIVNETKKMVQSLSLDALVKMAKGKIDMEALNALEGNEKAQAEQALTEHAKGVLKEVAKKRLSKGAKELPNELKALVQRGVEAIEAL